MERRRFIREIATHMEASDVIPDPYGRRVFLDTLHDALRVKGADSPYWSIAR